MSYAGYCLGLFTLGSHKFILLIKYDIQSITFSIEIVLIKLKNVRVHT